VTPALTFFIIGVTIAIVGISVAAFLVFANFLNREKERGKRFRARYASKHKDDHPPV